VDTPYPILAADSASHYTVSMSKAARTTNDGVDEIATVRIDLVYTDPPIWRQVEVPTAMTLETLHYVVQIVMGWSNCHLWEFTIAKTRYGLPMDDDFGLESVVDAGEVRLRDVLRPRKTRIDYMYDFGDSWEHRLTVTAIRPGEADMSYPRYLGGEYAGPPEDCGGIPGFYEILDALADSDHPDHDEISETFEGYDPQVIDEPAIQKALGRMASRGGKKRAKPT
jgi:hypothetical protein